MSGEISPDVLAERMAGFAALMEERELRYRLLREADQRALEIKAEGDKEARRIKEAGDEKALVLAREIQTYKDEKANELRAQIESERGSYATKPDLQSAVEKIDVKVDPMIGYVAAQTGQSTGKNAMWAYFVAAVVVISALMGIATTVIVLAVRLSK